MKKEKHSVYHWILCGFILILALGILLLVLGLMVGPNGIFIGRTLSI